MNAEKKRVEAYMLAAARKAGVPIPSGETPGEEPDFRFNDEIPGSPAASGTQTKLRGSTS